MTQTIAPLLAAFTLPTIARSLPFPLPSPGKVRFSLGLSFRPDFCCKVIYLALGRCSLTARHGTRFALPLHTVASFAHNSY
jgi:hypothetical protein